MQMILLDINNPQNIGEFAFLLFLVELLIALLLFAVVFGIGYWITQRPHTRSPFTDSPLLSASNLSFQAMQKVHSFVHALPLGSICKLDLNEAGVCRQTGRIFPNCTNRFGIVILPKNYLELYYPAKLIPWSALSSEQQTLIRQQHITLEKFQISWYNSSQPSVNSKFIYDSSYLLTKPGPLFVDLATATLVGWQCVPDTELELLIIQRPKEKALL
jgi:hypothetical protein